MRKRRWIHKMLAAVFVVGLVLVGSTPAFAQGDVSNAVVAGGEHVVTIPMWIWTLAVGTCIPLIVGLLTKLNAKPAVKILINLVLSALSGVIGTAVVADGVARLSTTTIVLAALSLVQSIATYAGIWRPLQAQTKLAPNAGLG